MKDFTRREFVTLSILQFLTIATSVSSLAEAAKGKDGLTRSLSWDSFLERLTAQALVARVPNWDQDTYVYRISRLATLLNINGIPGLETLRSGTSTNFSGPEFLDLHKTQDFQVSLINFEKGESIPLHNHPSMTGVLTCAEGELQVQEFDLVERYSAPRRSNSDHLESTLLQKGT